MKYYSLCHEVMEGGFTDGEVNFSPGLESYYRVGEYTELHDQSVTVVMDKKIRRLATDFFLTTSGAFFASNKMKLLLDECSSDLKLTSSEVKYFNGKDVEDDFFLLHADRRIPCFDYHRSEYAGKKMILNRIDSGELDADYKVRGIKSLVIVESKAENLDFFFVEGVTWLNPIVSSTFVEKAKREKLLVRADELE